MSEKNRKWDFPVRKSWSGEKPVAEVPQRFFGPVSADEAERLTDRLFEDKGFFQDFVDFAAGEFGLRELCYRIQASYEAEEEREKQPEPLEGTEFDEHETGGIGA